MSVNAITQSSYTSAASAAQTTDKTLSKAEKETTTKETESKNTTASAAESGVVYDRNSSTVNTDYVKNNASLIQKLKEDSEARISQLQGIVEKMMQKQGIAIGCADDMWKFLAEGDFTVSPETKAQAQADIADDGYWGVEQTSDRIVDFAKALSGGDASKADAMLEAFKKGFKEATSTWGKDLPDISQRTYDAVLRKFDEWKNGTDTDKADSSSDTAAADTN